VLFRVFSEVLLKNYADKRPGGDVPEFPREREDSIHCAYLHTVVVAPAEATTRLRTEMTTYS